MYAGLIGAPLALTSKTRLKDIINKAEIKESDNFYELGTGTGRVIRAVAEKTGARVTGFELSPVYFFLSWLNLILAKVQKYKLFNKNFFHADLSGADVVFFFLMPKSNERLKIKLTKELKPGSRVVSYAFKIADWTPYYSIVDNHNPSIYFYRI